MKIKTLSSVSRHEIFIAFKKAFDDYVIPLEIKEDSTLKRWELSGVNLNFSYGIFKDSELVAFILHIPCEDALFNFATGVIPSHRGQHLIEAIYEHIKIDIKDFKTLSLEVIRENTKALNLYAKLGFRVARELISYQGRLTMTSALTSGFDYQVLQLIYTQEMEAICLARPGLENSQATLAQNPAFHEVHEIRKNGELLAYAIFTPEVLTLREFGAKGNLEILDQLFLQMKLSEENLRIMNIDAGAKPLISYFQTRGLNIFVTQYEMNRNF